jgi:hypothetical protein
MNYLLMYDERKLAEQVLMNGFENGSYNWKEALLVAKHFRQIDGVGDSKVATQITSFCVANDPFFHPVPRSRTIKNLVRESRHSLVDYTDPIDIRQDEIDRIRNIKNFKLQQLGLGVLAIAKRNFKYNNGFLNRYYWKDVKGTVNIKHITNIEVERCFLVMKELEMVYASWTVNSHKILFIDHSSPVIFHIAEDREMRRLGAIYKEYCGGETSYCSSCGTEITKGSNRHRLCDECWREKELNRKKMWAR